MIDKREHLNKWLEAHKDQPIRIIGISTTGKYVNYGVNPDSFPWENKGIETDIEDFHTKPRSAYVRANKKWYKLVPPSSPQFRWGDTSEESN